MQDGFTMFSIEFSQEVYFDFTFFMVIVNETANDGLENNKINDGLENNKIIK